MESSEKTKTTKKTQGKRRGRPFDTDKELQKRATAKAHTKENVAKQALSRKKNLLLRNAIMESFKEILLTEDKKGVENYVTFLNAYMKDAIKKPSGKCGIQLASIVINEDTFLKYDLYFTIPLFQFFYLNSSLF